MMALAADDTLMPHFASVWMKEELVAFDVDPDGPLWGVVRSIAQLAEGNQRTLLCSVYRRQTIIAVPMSLANLLALRGL